MIAMPMRVSKDLWRQLGRAAGDAPWLVDKRREFSRGEALATAWALADKLDCKPREHIGVCVRDPFRHTLLLLALWLRGATAVAMNPSFPQTQRAKLLQQTECRYCLDDTLFADPPIASLLEKGNGCEAFIPYPDFDEAARAMILFTSGSTGTPKAAVLSLGNLFYNAAGVNQVMPLVSDDRWLLSLPLFHVGGLGIVLRTLLAGVRVVIPAEKSDLSSAVQTQPFTHLSLVPTQLYRLLKDPNHVPKLKALKHILVGGAGLSDSLLRSIEEHELPVYATYGCTEMASQVALFKIGCEATIVPLPYREWRLNQQGEIEVRGRTRFVGYWTQDGLQCPFDEEGWFATGDLGRQREGHLEVWGRKDAQFISGGENLHPETIEQALFEHPGIERVRVVPVDDAEFGARPVAFVDSASQQPAIWDAELRKRLAGFQVPDLFLPWPQSSAVEFKPTHRSLVATAQPLYDQWAKWRFLRKWLQKYPPGWKIPLAVGDRYLFQVIHHKHPEQPQSLFVLARSREQVMTWLLEGSGQRLLASDCNPSWSAVAQPLNRRVCDPVEVVRLLTEDLQPQELTAFDATCTEGLQSQVLSFPQPQPTRSYLTVIEGTEPKPYAFCLGSDRALPANENAAPILQLGMHFLHTQRSYALRCFYENSCFPQGLLGWKVQALREADGLEREQPFWDIEASEANMIEAVMRQQGLMPPNVASHTNLYCREHHRRRLWQQKLSLFRKGSSHTKR